MLAQNDEALTIFQNSLAAFLDTTAPPETIERWNQNKQVDRDAWLAAGEFGMLGVLVPEEHGGLGVDFRYERAIMEAFAERGLEGWGVPVHNMIAAPYLIEHGTPDQKNQWLPKVVSGETILAIAMTEPAAGSDLQGMRTRAVRDGDEWVINGSKVFISNGQMSDLYCCVQKPKWRTAQIRFRFFGRERPTGVQAGKKSRQGWARCAGHVRALFRRCPTSDEQRAGRGARERFCPTDGVVTPRTTGHCGDGAGHA